MLSRSLRNSDTDVTQEFYEFPETDEGLPQPIRKYSTLAKMNLVQKRDFQVPMNRNTCTNFYDKLDLSLT